MTTINPRAAALLDQIRRGDMPYPPMWAAVAVTLLDIAPGCVRMTAIADERHINAFGGVHGGYVASVLDTVLGLTVFVSLDEETARHTTVDLSVKIVKRVPLHTELVAEGMLVSLSRRAGVSQATLRDRAGAVYAHGTTTCFIQRAD